jgi:hypothetical protein
MPFMIDSKSDFPLSTPGDDESLLPNPSHTHRWERSFMNEYGVNLDDPAAVHSAAANGHHEILGDVPKLTDDADFMLRIIKATNSFTAHYASARLRGDLGFNIKAASVEPHALDHLAHPEAEAVPQKAWEHLAHFLGRKELLTNETRRDIRPNTWKKIDEEFIALHGNIYYMKQLLNAGINISTLDLDAAASLGSLRTVQLFIDHDKNGKNLFSDEVCAEALKTAQAKRDAADLLIRAEDEKAAKASAEKYFAEKHEHPSAIVIEGDHENLRSPIYHDGNYRD